MSILVEAAVYLAAAVVAVPLFRRLGLGSILGYLAAGAVIGPWGVRIVADVEDVLHFSELGVVFFLFLVGLELEPSRLWAMRRTVFGLGASQVLATGALLSAAMAALGLPWAAAIIGGLGLSLSSTAIALGIVGERGEIQTPHGRAAFAILLFQDLAVIPLLAVVPLLAVAPVAAAGTEGSPLLSIAKVVGVLAALVVGSRVVLRPAFSLIAKSKSQEVFTAAALLVVIGTALAVSAVGMSMALGAFLAGVLLADSEFRHELEADIEPFKGLLLGLFFMAVGMSVNMGLLVERPLAVLGAVLGLSTAKIVVLHVIGRLQRFPQKATRTLALALSQGGEFAFVLFGVAAAGGIMDRATADFLIVVVGVSMAGTPLLFPLVERVVEPLLDPKGGDEKYDAIDDKESRVIIAGFGRYGQIVARVLGMAGIPYTALEKSSDQVDFVRRFGNKLYFGDASRLDLLRAAKADHAKLFVLAIDDVEGSMRTAEIVKHNFPDLPIFARARNRNHVFKLHDLGVAYMNRDTYHSGLEMAREVLVGLGFDRQHAREVVAKFQAFDEEMLGKQALVWKDEAQVIKTAQGQWEQLRNIFAEDAAKRAPAATTESAAAPAATSASEQR